MSFRRSLAVASLGLIAAGAPLAAQSTMLIAPQSNECLAPNFGNTSFLTFSFTTTAGFGTFTQQAGAESSTCVRGWSTGYGTMSTAFWSNGSNLSTPSSDVLQITALAVDPTRTVTLASLLTGDWNRGVGTVHSLRVYSLAGLLLFNGAQTLAGSSEAQQTLSWAPNVSAVGGLRVQWGEDPWFVGGNNLAFTVTDTQLPQGVIPEPSTYVLLATGLAGLAVVRRRRARAA